MEGSDFSRTEGLGHCMCGPSLLLFQSTHNSPSLVVWDIEQRYGKGAGMSRIGERVQGFVGLGVQCGKLLQS